MDGDGLPEEERNWCFIYIKGNNNHFDDVLLPTRVSYPLKRCFKTFLSPQWLNTFVSKVHTPWEIDIKSSMRNAETPRRRHGDVFGGGVKKVSIHIFGLFRALDGSPVCARSGSSAVLMMLSTTITMLHSAIGLQKRATTAPQSSMSSTREIFECNRVATLFCDGLFSGGAWLGAPVITLLRLWRRNKTLLFLQRGQENFVLEGVQSNNNIIAQEDK